MKNLSINPARRHDTIGQKLPPSTGNDEFKAIASAHASSMCNFVQHGGIIYTLQFAVVRVHCWTPTVTAGGAAAGTTAIPTTRAKPATVLPWKQTSTVVAILSAAHTFLSSSDARPSRRQVDGEEEEGEALPATTTTAADGWDDTWKLWKLPLLGGEAARPPPPPPATSGGNPAMLTGAAATTAQHARTTAALTAVGGAAAAAAVVDVAAGLRR